MVLYLKKTNAGGNTYMFGGFFNLNTYSQTSGHEKTTDVNYSTRKNAYDQMGKWTRVTYANGETKTTTVQNLRFTNSGGILYDEAGNQ
jgi:hypothetical protein